MCICNQLDDFYDMKTVEDIPGLAESLTELNVDGMKWETLYECNECGQKWLERYTSRGRGDIPEVRKVQ